MTHQWRTQAEEVCCSIGQFWKAATLEGWKLFHDPNITDEGMSFCVTYMLTDDSSIRVF